MSVKEPFNAVLAERDALIEEVAALRQQNEALMEALRIAVEAVEFAAENGSVCTDPVMDRALERVNALVELESLGLAAPPVASTKQLSEQEQAWVDGIAAAWERAAPFYTDAAATDVARLVAMIRRLTGSAEEQP